MLISPCQIELFCLGHCQVSDINLSRGCPCLVNLTSFSSLCQPDLCLMSGFWSGFCLSVTSENCQGDILFIILVLCTCLSVFLFIPKFAQFGVFYQFMFDIYVWLFCVRKCSHSEQLKAFFFNTDFVFVFSKMQFREIFQLPDLSV